MTAAGATGPVLGSPGAAALPQFGGHAAIIVTSSTPLWYITRAPAAAGVPVSPPGLRSAGASLGAGVLIALPAACCGLAETARVLRYLAAQSAGQCGPCTFGLPVIAPGPVPADLAEHARRAVASCPTLALRLERQARTV